MKKNISLSFLILFITIVCVGCGTKTAKTPFNITLGKTTLSDASKEYNFDMVKSWNEDKSIYEYAEDYGYIDSYVFENITGKLEVYCNTESKKAEILNIQFKSSLDYGVDMVNYMGDTYGTEFETIDDTTNRWVDGNTTIDLINDGDDVVISWYITK